MPPAKPSLLVVAATYATEETRKKIDALAAHFEVVCVTCRSYTGYGLVNRLADQPMPTTYRLIGLPCVGPPESTTHYHLAGLGAVLRAEPPADFVLVESEPWARVRWQTWWAARRWQRAARFGEFSWENAQRPGWKGLVLQGIYRAAVRTSAFTIAGSAEAGGFFRAAGRAADRLLVAPQLGVDPEVFYPADAAERTRCRAARNLPQDVFLVGFSGRLAEEKGVWDLVAAVARWRAEGPAPGGRDVHLAILGHGPLAEPLRTRAAAQGATPWLHVFGSCPHPEMARFMRALDLFVLPSRELNQGGERWKEQFGHVLIEAMGCGVPTVGSDCGAIPEVIGDPALIFRWREPARLWEHLRDLANDPAQLAAAGAAGRARVGQRYTHATLAQIWADFLCGLPGSASSDAITRT